MTDIKLKVIARFPLNIAEGLGIDLVQGNSAQSNSVWSYSLDYTEFPTQSAPTPNAQILVWDAQANHYFLAGLPLLQSSIVTTPDPLFVSEGATIGTVVGTVSISNPHSATYTYALLDDAGGKYTISGNQIEVAAALTVGTDSITIQATGNLGDVLTLATTVTVRSLAYVPTYYIYGF